MAKTVSSAQKELNDLKSDRSLVKSPASSKIRGPVCYLHVRNINYPKLVRTNDDVFDVDYSDKSDIDEALNTFIEGDASNQGYSDEDEEGLALHELSEFFDDEFVS